jgi:hypothetical protein
LALDLSERIGCRLLTVDAKVNPGVQLSRFYEALGFMPNRAKNYRDRQNPSLRIDVFGQLGASARG